MAVGAQIGFGWATLLLIAVSALGPFLVRRVGLGVLARSQERLAQGELPSREILDGVVVLGGGALICVPGFVGDAIGLLLLIGPVRHVLIRVAGRRMARRVRVMRLARWNIVDARSQRTATATATLIQPSVPPIGPDPAATERP